MNNINLGKDVLIRGVTKETVQRIDDRAAKLGLSRSSYLKMFLENTDIEAKISERTRILVEVLQINNELMKQVKELLERVEERL